MGRIENSQARLRWTVLIHFAITLMALIFQLFGWIYTNWILMILCHVGLWILWFTSSTDDIAEWGPVSALIFTGVAWLVTLIFAFWTLWNGINCIAYDIACPVSPQTGAQTTLTSIIYFISFGFIFMAWTALNTIVQIQGISMPETWTRIWNSKKTDGDDEAPTPNPTAMSPADSSYNSGNARIRSRKGLSSNVFD